MVGTGVLYCPMYCNTLSTQLYGSLYDTVHSCTADRAVRAVRVPTAHRPPAVYSCSRVLQVRRTTGHDVLGTALRGVTVQQAPLSLPSIRSGPRAMLGTNQAYNRSARRQRQAVQAVIHILRTRVCLYGGR